MWHKISIVILILLFITSCASSLEVEEVQEEIYTLNCENIVQEKPNMEYVNEYVILSTDLFLREFSYKNEYGKLFLDHLNENGFSVSSYPLEIPLCLYDGRDEPEKIRNFLKDLKANGAQYLLIIGDADYEVKNEDDSFSYEIDKPWEVPMRYVIVDDKYSEFPTDQYYASLQTKWDDNEDGLYDAYGFYDEKDTFSLEPDLYVGRIPVRNVDELHHVLSNIANWQPKEKPSHSVFQTNLCRPGVSFNYESYLEQLIPQTQDITAHVCTNDNGGDMINYVNQDKPNIVSSFSHAGVETLEPITIDGQVYGYYFNESSEQMSSNSLYYVYGCGSAAIDSNVDSVAEIFLKDKAISYIGATAVHADRHFNPFESVFFDNHLFLGEALFEYKYKLYSENALAEPDLANLLKFNLFGDPALKVYEPKLIIKAPDVIVFYESEPQNVTINITNLKPYPITITVDYTSLGVVEDTIGAQSTEVYSFEVYPISTSPMEITLILSDIEGSSAIEKIKQVNNYEISVPSRLNDLVAGETASIPIKVLYSKEEITIEGKFKPGCYEGSCPDSEDYEILFSLTKDFSENNDLLVTFTVPENPIKLDSELTYETAYYFPSLIVETDLDSTRTRLSYED